MSDMLDRVAKALGETVDSSCIDSMPCSAYGVDCQCMKAMARAAIEAMREPTFEMLCEGQSQIYIERNENPIGPHTYASREETSDAWTAMIETAIK